MSEKRSLAVQRQSIETLIEYCRDVDTLAVEAAKQACLTIGWLERRSELIRMLDKLERERPDLAAALNTIARVFPGIEISDVRKREMQNV